MDWVYSLFHSALIFEADDGNLLNKCPLFFWKSGLNIGFICFILAQLVLVRPGSAPSWPGTLKLPGTAV